MRYSHVCIESWGTVLPKRILTSSDIEKKLTPLMAKLELPSGFFEIFTGIKERRLWENGTLPSQMSTQAAQNALQREKIKNSEIECLLHVSVSRDYLEPATAATVHDNLKLNPSAMYFDISNACLGFLNGIFVLSNMIELGQIKRGMLVGTESSQKMIDMTLKKILDSPALSLQEAALYLPSLTLGSGAAALILAHDSVSKTKHKLLDGISRTASQFNHLCRAFPDTGLLNPIPNLSMKTQANELMQEAAKLAKTTWGEFKKEIQWEDKDIHHIFSHQVGRTPREEMIKALGVPSDKDYFTFDRLGNMGSCALPITFAMGIEKRNVKKDDHVVLMGFGSGINCLFFGIRW